MLVLSRVPKALRDGHCDVTVYTPAGDTIAVTVLSSTRGVVRLGVTAPKTHQIYREEIDPHGRHEDEAETARPSTPAPDRPAA